MMSTASSYRLVMMWRTQGVQRAWLGGGPWAPLHGAQHGRQRVCQGVLLPQRRGHRQLQWEQQVNPQQRQLLLLLLLRALQELQFGSKRVTRLVVGVG